MAIYIYIFAHSQGPRKIGVTKDPVFRLSQLQKANPYRLTSELAELCDTLDARVIERYAHACLFSKRLGHEWFDVSLDEALKAIDYGKYAAAAEAKAKAA